MGVAVCSSVMFGLGLALWWATREPLCQGRPVRAWVEQMGMASYGPRDLAEEQLQSSADVAVPALLEALRTDGKSLRDRINDWWGKAYSKLPKGIQKFAPQPRAYLRMDRRMWISALARIGPRDKRVVTGIIRELQSKDSEVRFFATSALGNLVVNWANDAGLRREIIHTLEKMLSDPAYNVRGCAAYGLSKCGPAAGESVPRLIGMLADPQEHVQVMALRAISQIGGESNVVVHAITPLLQSTQSLTRAFAAYVLCRATGEMEPGLPVLVGLLSAEEPEGAESPRSVAASLIGRLGKRAETALPALQRAMENSETDGRMTAAVALWKISGNPSNAIAVLRPILGHGSRSERIWITENLAQFGPDAAEALPELTAALAAEDFLIRRNAVRAVGSIGPAARGALPQLRFLLNDEFPSIRASAAEAIKKVSGN